MYASPAPVVSIASSCLKLLGPQTYTCMATTVQTALYMHTEAAHSQTLVHACEDLMEPPCTARCRMPP